MNTVKLLPHLVYLKLDYKICYAAYITARYLSDQGTQKGDKVGFCIVIMYILAIDRIQRITANIIHEPIMPATEHASESLDKFIIALLQYVEDP